MGSEMCIRDRSHQATRLAEMANRRRGSSQSTNVSAEVAPQITVASAGPPRPGGSPRPRRQASRRRGRPSHPVAQAPHSRYRKPLATRLPLSIRRPPGPQTTGLARSPGTQTPGPRSGAGRPASRRPHRPNAARRWGEEHHQRGEDELDRQQGHGLKPFACLRRARKDRTHLGGRTRSVEPAFFKIGEPQFDMASMSRRALRGRRPGRKIVHIGKGEA